MFQDSSTNTQEESEEVAKIDDHDKDLKAPIVIKVDVGQQQ